MLVAPVVHSCLCIYSCRRSFTKRRDICQVAGRLQDICDSVNQQFQRYGLGTRTSQQLRKHWQDALCDEALEIRQYKLNPEDYKLLVSAMKSAKDALCFVSSRLPLSTNFSKRYWQDVENHFNKHRPAGTPFLTKLKLRNAYETACRKKRQKVSLNCVSIIP